VRAAAAELVEIGRTLGSLEMCQALHADVERVITRTAETHGAAEFAELLADVHELRRGLVRLQSTYSARADDEQRRARQLVEQLEPVGVALARRIIRTVRAVRAAWRG
jgi:hypothetical protein